MNASYLAWKGWDGKAFGHLEPEEAGYFSAELRASGIASVHGLKIGELGYGNGGFAAWVRRNDGQWIGRETRPELLQRALRAGYQALAADAAFSTAGGLDLLVAWDVLEHLEPAAIRAFLVEARDGLRSGGALLFRIPSGDSPFAGAIFNGDLTHRTMLGSSAVHQLALETGFRVSQIRSPVLPVLGLGPVRLLRRALLRAVQKPVFSLIRNLLMGNPAAVVSPNMLVVLRKG